MVCPSVLTLFHGGLMILVSSSDCSIDVVLYLLSFVVGPDASFEVSITSRESSFCCTMIHRLATFSLSSKSSSELSSLSTHVMYACLPFLWANEFLSEFSFLYKFCSFTRKHSQNPPKRSSSTYPKLLRSSSLPPSSSLRSISFAAVAFEGSPPFEPSLLTTKAIEGTHSILLCCCFFTSLITIHLLTPLVASVPATAPRAVTNDRDRNSHDRDNENIVSLLSLFDWYITTAATAISSVHHHRASTSHRSASTSKF
ncbi:hypothetical protein RIF29_38732 [Crotalaria pallida]|uniref:Uncharacterized protein n=1 Tax=Crotalaria pallida TaxID=3830 RepID=A0AAN9DZU8_CROPI